MLPPPRLELITSNNLHFELEFKTVFMLVLYVSPQLVSRLEFRVSIVSMIWSSLFDHNKSEVAVELLSLIHI